jgi:predicted metal-dependent hydrolase
MLDPRNIIRTNKRTLSLLGNVKGELILCAPYEFPEHRIFDFKNEKQDWIIKKQNAVRANSYINQNVVNYSSYMFLGRELTPMISSAVKDITVSGGILYIPSKIPNEKIFGKIEKWFRKTAAEVITERAVYFRERLRLNPEDVTVNNNKTRWGVCDSKNRIAINWRAVFLPPNLLDYLIVHEFCHLLEFNHTKNFWAVVQTIVPDWRTIRTHLKHLNWLLMLFRPVY